MFESCDDILSVDDIAAILKVGNTQVYKLLRSGRLKAYKEGKDWKIPKESLILYIKEQAHLI